MSEVWITSSTGSNDYQSGTRDLTALSTPDIIKIGPESTAPGRVVPQHLTGHLTGPGRCIIATGTAKLCTGVRIPGSVIK